MDRKQREAEAICNAGIDACKKVCERKLFVFPEGRPPASFADRRKQLAADLEGFAPTTRPSFSASRSHAS